MSEKTCVALAFSPRRGGNTDILLESAVEKMGSSGVNTEIIYMAGLSYSPCRACEGCYSTGRCVIRDDAGPVYEKILKAQMLVMAAPVFSMGICAQAKTFIDRAQQFWAVRYVLGGRAVEDRSFRESRRGMYISCAGTNLPGVFDGSIRVVRYFFKMIDVKLAGVYCYPGTDKKGEILGNKSAMDEIINAAADLMALPGPGRPDNGRE
ncbi:MAG: flavodoxin family protein [Bacillota bacterium]